MDEWCKENKLVEKDQKMAFKSKYLTELSARAATGSLEVLNNKVKIDNNRKRLLLARAYLTGTDVEDIKTAKTLYQAAASDENAGHHMN